jgi:serine-type D-Ala-D-Ala carboxypeptidase (penicillin-binding protein 5/6)
MSRGRKQLRPHTKKWSLLIVVFLLLCAGLGTVMYLRPLPPIYPVDTTLPALNVPKFEAISWPTASEAAIGAAGFGVISTNGDQTQRPTASVAKLITALTVLHADPLSLGQQQAPLITISQTDVNLYNQYLAEDGSVVKVALGEQLSEYQALEAMLLPSANNMADSLALWAFGSMSSYKAAATTYIQSIGLTQTTIGADASGFLPSTTSSAHDLVLLGITALQNPVIAQIVAEQLTTLPVAGTIQNVNWLLGYDGINGIKTGNTDQAGGVYVFSSKDKLSSSDSIDIVGAIEGTPTLQAALNDTVPLLNTIKGDFRISTLVTKNGVVARYTSPWGSR